MSSRSGRSAPAPADAPSARRNGAPPQPAARCVASVFDLLDLGVLMCDAEGRVLLVNQPARFELARGTLLQWRPPQHLQAADEAAHALLMQACEEAALQGLRRLVPLRRGADRLIVAVQPPAWPDPDCPCAVLLLGRRASSPELAVELLGRPYDLTAAERRVLSGLLSGLQVSELARGHGVAVSTVRTQVASLRAKFGVHRIDDLIRLAMELPPMPGALRGTDPAARG